MHSMTTEERRILRLEEEVEMLKRALDSVKHKLGQAAEDAARQIQDDGSGRVLVRAQAVGAIGAGTADGTLGTGTARLLQVISGRRYKLQALSLGDVTVDVVNDTGSGAGDKEYLILANVDGLWTCVVGDCATATPAVAADPPSS
jgi:hypothetical protein